ncbi:MAG TPA: DUF2089 family protein [Chloroflexota bacterium]|nr:DUF2089 family protein [Chloroflexota bacterium]
MATAPLPPPASCPACGDGLLVTRLQCPTCATEVSGTFSHPGRDAGQGALGGPETAGRLVNLPEPYASLLELFLRVRGNVKDVERELGLSYPTVRARLDEAFKAALPLLTAVPHPPDPSGTAPPAPPAPPLRERAAILSALERGEISAAQATARLRALHTPTEESPR